MKTPHSLEPLLEEGVIDGVLGALQSGKEAAVYLVACGEQVFCAKVYKDAKHRSFQKLAEYQEGRKRRGSRDTRALHKRSRYGRAAQESAWKNAEVEALYRLAAAGVRVPQPHGVYDGVLLMELVRDAEGHPAPRLNDISLEPAQARAWHDFLLEQVVRMLCAGMIHGDLSEYNILAAAEGPVIIDLPQAVDATVNNNAFRLLQRDVDNLRGYFGRFVPELLKTEYAHEIWDLYERRDLHPGTVLTGRFVHDTRPADTQAIRHEIQAAEREAAARERGRREAEAERNGKG